MAGQRQPIDLLLIKGKKHLTKEEIERRKNEEIHAPDDNIMPPEWLTKKQKARFAELAIELIRVGIISNLDCEALGWFVVLSEQFIETTKKIRKTKLMIDIPVYDLQTDNEGNEQKVLRETRKEVNPERERLMRLQSSCLKQCRQLASDFGLTVSSRCRLIVPKAEPQRTENKFSKFME